MWPINKSQNIDRKVTDQPQKLKDINIATKPIGVTTLNVSYMIIYQWVFIFA